MGKIVINYDDVNDISAISLGASSYITEMSKADMVESLPKIYNYRVVEVSVNKKKKLVEVYTTPSGQVTARIKK